MSKIDKMIPKVLLIFKQIYSKDFNEIVTLVIDDIKKRRVRYDECMVPEQISSFSKKLYLPPLK